VPFAREYGGLLANRSFGGAQVSRTFYARGQTGQQLLLGAYSALMRQVGEGRVALYPRHDMLDVVLVDGVARGIVCRDLHSGEVRSFAGDAVLLCTGGYGNVFYLSTNAKACNVTAAWRAHRRGALFGNPCFTQIHPTCIPVSGEYQSKLTLMSESLRNDGRVWVPLRADDARAPHDIPDAERDYYLERKYPSFGNLSPRDISSRAAKQVCDEGRGVGASKMAVYLDFRDAIARDGLEAIRARYGNLFQMYERITGEDPYRVPMRIFPAVHYTMGGVWVDYNLESTVPGPVRARRGELLRPRRQPARRERADAGARRRVLHRAVHGRGAPRGPQARQGRHGSRGVPAHGGGRARASGEAARRQGAQEPRRVPPRARAPDVEPVRDVARRRRARGRAPPDPRPARGVLAELHVPGDDKNFNQTLEHAGRVADFFELAELMCIDARTREESCGGHFREEHQTADGEAKRDDAGFCHASAWEFSAGAAGPTWAMHKEPLVFENVVLSERSYK
jgi:succinate dehydrogenase / fumarate reductase flavoprotein subunit